jgi:glycerol-3-phosphate acyltransferase PlsY
VLAVSYLTGSIPFSNIAARRLKGVDLRYVGTGTVSGTGLHQVAGFGPLAVVGCTELAKGAAGPLLARMAGRSRRVEALAAAAAVTGHNWSPFLGLKGGRGVSVALGASLATRPEAALVLGLGLGGGRLAKQSGAGCALAIAALAPALWRVRGSEGLLLGASLALPLAAKRIIGNHPPPSRDLRHYAHRFLFDRDPSDGGPGSAGSASVPGDGGAVSGDRDPVRGEGGVVSGDRVERSRQQPAAVAAAQQN